MRRIPTEEQVEILYHKHILKLQDRFLEDFRIGENFEIAYFEFIDKYDLGNCEP